MTGNTTKSTIFITNTSGETVKLKFKSTKIVLNMTPNSLKEELMFMNIRERKQGTKEDKNVRLTMRR